jgi:lipopolysaccharide heptosyltransferase II
MPSRLVIAPNWIGDSVMAIPFLRALKRRFPADRLTVLARRGPGSIFRAESSANAVGNREGLVRDIAALRREKADEVWLLPNSFRSALMAFLAGIPVRIGYDTDRRGGLLTHAVPPPPRTDHQLRDYDRLLRSRGIEPDFDVPRLPLPEQAERRARETLERAGLASSRLALLAPGAAATFGQTKRWPVERFGKLVDRLRDRGFDCACVIGPGEGDLGARLSAAARGPVPVLGSELDPVELAALLSRAKVLIGNDSGPIHLAASVGTPIVAFFGPTDPGRTAPAGAPARILDRYVFCSPCFLKECPYGHECMEEIRVEDAVRAVEELVG